MDTLEAFIDQLAAHVAHTRGWTLDEATRWVQVRIAKAREEYRAAGALRRHAWMNDLTRKQPLERLSMPIASGEPR
jgi:hypothetical protein